MNMPVVFRNGSYTALPKGQNLYVPASLGTGMTTITTSESLLYDGVKVKVGEESTLANGGTVEVDISNAASDFVTFSVFSSIAGAGSNTDTLDLDNDDDWYEGNFEYSDAGGGMYLNADGFYDYGSMTYENVTDSTKLKLWKITDGSDSDIFKSWVATASSNGDASYDKQKTLTVSSADSTTKTLKLVSDIFMIPNYGTDMKLEFYFDTSVVTAGGTVDFVKVEIVEAMNPDDMVLQSTSDLWALGSGHVSIALNDDVFNRKVKLAIDISFTGAAGPAEVSFTIDQLKIVNTGSGKAVKLYTLNSDTYLKPVMTTYIDYSSEDSDWTLSSLKVSDGLQVVEGVYVAISKDYNNWFYHDGDSWVLIDKNDPYSSKMTGKDLYELGSSELDFLLKDNDDKKLYFMFTINEDVLAKSYSVKEVSATFEEQDTLTAISSGVDVTVIPRRKVTFTNNTGADINGFVGAVAYV